MTVAERVDDLVRKVFLGCQLKWIRDRSKMRLGLKSRQVGWTWTNAFEDVMDGVGTKRGHNTHFMAGDTRGARDYINDAANWSDELKVAANRFTEDWFDPKTELVHKIMCIEFPNGTRLEAMSSNPRALRGRRGNVKLDEFDFHDNPKELLRSAPPVTRWGGRLSIWSTPNGQGTVFSRMCEMAERRLAGNPRKGDMKWSFHRVTLLDAIADGLVERLNARSGQTLTHEQFIEECRSSCLTEEDFQQEYMCNPSAESLAWLPYDMIDACMRDVIFDPSMDGPGPSAVAGRTEDVDRFIRSVLMLSIGASEVVAGVDFGRKHDRFVIFVLAKFGEVWRTAGLLSWRGKRWAEMRYAISRLMDARRDGGRHIVTRMCLDATGMGDEPSEWAEETYRHRAEGVKFTVDSKQNMAVLVRNAFEDRHVLIPFDDTLRDDLHSVIKEIMPSGKPRFVGERTADGHADHFWALGLSMLAGSAAPKVARVVTVVGGSY